MALCVALLAARFATTLHAFEHDLDAVDGQTCPVCITAAQLGDVCVDTSHPVPVEPAGFVVDPVCIATFSSVYAVIVRQRGPPEPA